MSDTQPIRVGVVGVRRGQSFMRQASSVGMELVAICDTWEERLAEVGQRHGIATYTDFDELLGHDLDAVILANYFHEHAPFAIKALAAGKHVMSECAACNTLAEGVALCRAVEQSGRIYMFAENCPYTAFNIEIARLYREGEIGRVLYAEGEYIHPGSFDWYMGIAPGLRHWRNNYHATYYCTHALAPLMTITDTMPVRVSGFAVPLPEDSARKRLWRQQDAAGLIIAQMDSGAVFKLIQGNMPGHSLFYRLHGELGLMESTRGPGHFGPGSVRVVHEEGDLRPGQVPETCYYPRYPDWTRVAASAGHGGADFFTNYYFAEAIRRNEQPYLNVYRGVAMSVVGILAWKSVLNGGASYAVPDFAREESRQAYDDDHWRPMDLDDPNAPAISSRGKQREVIPENLEHAREIWNQLGYRGDDR